MVEDDDDDDLLGSLDEEDEEDDLLLLCRSLSFSRSLSRSFLCSPLVLVLLLLFPSRCLSEDEDLWEEELERSLSFDLSLWLDLWELLPLLLLCDDEEDRW